MSEDANARYYVKVRGKQVGPIGMDRLREMVKQNQVSRVSQISPDGKTWFKAGELAELFEPPKTSMVGAASGPNGKSWYYATGGNKTGPVDVTELANLLRVGTLSGKDLAWRQGMNEWQAIGAISDLAGFVPAAEGADPLGMGGDIFENSGQAVPNPYWQAQQYPYPRVSKPVSTSGGLEPNPDDGSTILVLGIVGLFFPICAYIAWAMGASYLSTSKQMNYIPGSSGKTGYILGMVVGILWLAGMIIGCLVWAYFFFILLFFSAASAAGA